MKHIRLCIWITGILLAVLAPIQLYRSHRAFGFWTAFEFIYLILPPILFIGTAYLLNKKPGNSTLHIISCSCLTGVLGFYTLITLGMEMFINSRPIINVNKYENVLSQWKQFAPDIVSHFPDPIPPDAQNIEFYFSPGLFQADDEIQLRFKTTSEIISDYYNEFLKITTKSYYGETFVHFLPHKKDGQIIELGQDFEVLQFDKDPNNIHEHGKRHGVIINKRENIIIFWAEW
jgi:hypothetical protein